MNRIGHLTWSFYFFQPVQRFVIIPLHRSGDRKPYEMINRVASHATYPSKQIRICNEYRYTL